MSLKPLIAKLARLGGAQEDGLAESKPSLQRSNLAGDDLRRGGRASADIFHATDVALDVTLGLADLRKLLSGQDVKIQARDRKRVTNQSNVYTLNLRYKGRGVPDQ